MSQQQPYGEYPQYPQASADYQMQQPAYQLPTAPDGRLLAGAGQRLGARLIDSVVLIAAWALFGALVAGLIALVAEVAGDDSPIVVVVAVVGITGFILGVNWIYEVEVPLRYRGQTLGKRAVNIAIAPLEPGRQLSRGQLGGRFGMMLLYNILGSLCYVGILDPLWCLWDKPYRQCLHDKPAKTVVVKTAV